MSSWYDAHNHFVISQLSHTPETGTIACAGTRASSEMRGSVFLGRSGAEKNYMPHPDLYVARKHSDSMRDLIVHHRGGWRDVESLKKLQQTTAAVANALDDLESRHLASVISELGVALFSADDHEKWAQGRTSGADVLRLRILREITALQGRIAYVESVRSGAVHASGSPKISPVKPR